MNKKKILCISGAVLLAALAVCLFAFCGRVSGTDAASRESAVSESAPSGTGDAESTAAQAGTAGGETEAGETEAAEETGTAGDTKAARETDTVEASMEETVDFSAPDISPTDVILPTQTHSVVDK